LACLAAVGAVTLAIVAHSGGGKGIGMSSAGDWSQLGGKLIAGEIFAVFAWGFFQLGSQRIVLAEDTMRIMTLFLTWTVGRHEVANVSVTRQYVTIVLVDGSTIEPMMFWSSGSGLFPNANSRVTISEKILQWRGPYDPEAVDRSVAQRLARRHISQLRANLPFLVGLVALVAVEAIVATAFL
jgi:hypothetical protein